MDNFLIAFEALTASDISAMKTVCNHSGGLHQHKVNSRFQPLVTLGLVYVQAVKNGNGVRYKAHDPVLVHFESWINNRSAIAL